MKKIVLISALATVGVVTGAIFSTSSTTSDKNLIPEVKNDRITEHFNMMIVPDLSNRIDSNNKPKPVSDLEIIGIVLNCIEDGYLKSQGRRMNQKDRFQLLFTNQTLINKHSVNTNDMLLDFSQFDKQRERIDYINDRGSNGSFSADLDRMKKQTEKIYSSAREDFDGADIWSFMKNLNASEIKTSGSIKAVRTADGKEFENEYRNVIILLTDGYIEAGRYPNNQMCPSLSEKRIASFRTDFNRKGSGRSIEEFFNDEGYGITPVHNPLLQEVEVIVMELDDRSVDKSGNATQDVSDMEIIKTFWSDWLAKSGVKRFALHSKSSSVQEANQSIKDFLAY
jgi:hypothetical protein